MLNEEPDEIKEWLRVIAESDPFSRLRKFNQESPNKPPPPELEFAARVASIVGEDDGAISYDQELAQQIDGWISEDDARTGAASLDRRPGLSIGDQMMSKSVPKFAAYPLVNPTFSASNTKSANR